MDGRSIALGLDRRLVARRAGTFGVCLAALVALGLGSVTAKAGASCTSVFPHLRVEGIDNSWHDTNAILGWRATIHVNNFSGPQCTTVRTIGPIKNDNNFIEFGWRDYPGHPHEVFWVREEDGVYHESVAGISPAGGTDRAFQVVNENADNDWRLLYQGSAIQSNVHQNYAYASFALTNSEKAYSEDDLYAHFSDINVCTVGCNYHTPEALSETVNNTANWKFCKVNNTNHYVKQNSC